MYFEESELSEEIESLNTSKSPGFDETKRGTEMSKKCNSQGISSTVSEILGESVVPMDWKRANIIALHKLGEKREPNNYRPVSLTSVCCKLMEKLVRSQFLKYLIRN